MPIELIVNNTPFNYPSPGDEPGWGEAATGWAGEVTSVLGDIFAPGDILESTFTIPSVQATFVDIVGLAFNTGVVRSAVIEYAVYRVSTAFPSGNAESGILTITYDNGASAGNKWQLVGANITGNSGVTFRILDSGQLQYTATDLTTGGYSGKLKYKARTLQQT